eukprot:UN23039
MSLDNSRVVKSKKGSNKNTPEILGETTQSTEATGLTEPTVSDKLDTATTIRDIDGGHDENVLSMASQNVENTERNAQCIVLDGNDKVLVVPVVVVKPPDITSKIVVNNGEKNVDVIVSRNKNEPRVAIPGEEKSSEKQQTTVNKQENVNKQKEPTVEPKETQEVEPKETQEVEPKETQEVEPKETQEVESKELEKQTEDKVETEIKTIIENKEIMKIKEKKQGPNENELKIATVLENGLMMKANWRERG